MKNFFNNILKEDGKWSQGRIYLLLSVLAYYATLGIVTIKGINGKSQLDIESFKIIIDALQFSMSLFGGYVLGGKILSVIALLKGDKSKTQN